MWAEESCAGAGSGMAPQVVRRCLVDGSGGAGPVPRPARGRWWGPVAVAERMGDAEEAALLRLARQGDTAAFTRLVTPLMQPAYQFALRLVGERELAEDVTQEALIKAYTALTSFRGESRFRTWVFRIVQNACTDALRRRMRHPEAPAAWGDGQEAGWQPVQVPDPGPGPEDTVLAAMDREVILRAIAALPSEQRALILLRDVQGWAYGEIAAVTRQQMGTIKSRLHRARATLRAALGEVGPAAGKAGATGVDLGTACARGWHGTERGAQLQTGVGEAAVTGAAEQSTCPGVIAVDGEGTEAMLGNRSAGEAK